MKTTNVRSNDTVLMALAREMTDATVTAASSGNNTVIAAPGANKRLAIAYCKVQRTQGVTAETVILCKKGAAGDTFAYSVTSNDIPGEVLIDAVSELQLRVLPPAADCGQVFRCGLPPLRRVGRVRVFAARQ